MVAVAVAADAEEAGVGVLHLARYETDDEADAGFGGGVGVRAVNYGALVKRQLAGSQHDIYSVRFVDGDGYAFAASVQEVRIV